MTEKANFDRRDFLKKLGVLGAGFYLAGCSKKNADSLPTPFTANTTQIPLNQPDTEAMAATQTPQYGDVYMAVTHGEDIPEMTRRALEALGGIEQFIPSGANVIIKPNICTDYYPYEYGATTNPVLVATLVSLVLGAGAKRVRVMDNPFGGTAQSAYKKSGIQDAVIQAGGEMEVMNANKFKDADIPDGLDIKQWKFYKDILDADVVINVPIAKHHGTTGLTLGCKNLLGTILNRGQIHANIHQRIADLVSRVRPTLTIVDAVRTLMRNGPTGGNLDDVRMTNTLIASADIVAADAYAATLFDLQGSDIGYIQAAANMGLGTLDLNNVKIEELIV
jgi:uncharacterized protein (DUF362 family)